MDWVIDENCKDLMATKQSEGKFIQKMYIVYGQESTALTKCMNNWLQIFLSEDLSIALPGQSKFLMLS
jgi:hypothetical protein